MKKKISIILAIIFILVTFSSAFVMFKGNRKDSKVNSRESKQSNVDFYVKYAYADIDMDQIIQDVDKKDDDTSADYIFIRFSAEVIQNNDETSIGNPNNYKLNGQPLPKGSESFIRKEMPQLLIFKIPQGTLKNKNSGHTIEISKNVLNGKNKIIGETKLLLPYSEPIKDEGQNKKDDNKEKNNKEQDVKNGQNKNVSNVPKYKVEVGKGIPYNTLVLVKIQEGKAEDYKVSIDNVGLEIKETNEKQKVHVGYVKKDYSYSEVLQKVKVEKIIKK
ncbi:hypothetical protein [Clostridium tetani]|uniref:hypothetical protein n=1 Tax=Clostridium tetani TaxID=1513 RepID=UPI0024A7DA69|nr:hypothetical protein [Clostridium tetani]